MKINNKGSLNFSIISRKSADTKTFQLAISLSRTWIPLISTWNLAHHTCTPFIMLLKLITSRQYKNLNQFNTQKTSTFSREMDIIWNLLKSLRRPPMAYIKLPCIFKEPYWTRNFYSWKKKPRPFLRPV